MQPSFSSEQETLPAAENTRPVKGVTVAEFAVMFSMSERSAWTVIKQEAEKAQAEGRKSLLPLVTLIDGGHMRRLRMKDIDAWSDSLG